MLGLFTQFSIGISVRVDDIKPPQTSRLIVSFGIAGV